MKDWRGTPLEIGSRIVYPSRQGSKLWMNEGEVVKLKPFAVRKLGGQRLSHPAPSRVTVIP